MTAAIDTVGIWAAATASPEGTNGGGPGGTTATDGVSRRSSCSKWDRKVWCFTAASPCKDEEGGRPPPTTASPLFPHLGNCNAKGAFVGGKTPQPQGKWLLTFWQPMRRGSRADQGGLVGCATSHGMVGGHGTWAGSPSMCSTLRNIWAGTWSKEEVILSASWRAHGAANNRAGSAW